MQEDIAAIDRQILRLIRDRIRLCANEDHAGDDEHSLEMWLEEAIDLDLDEHAVEKICSAVVGLCKKEGE